MKKSNKYLFAALSAAAVIVAPVAMESEAATFDISGVLLIQDSQTFLLTMDDYISGLGDGFVKTQNISHIQLSTNSIYTMSDYIEALGDNGSMPAAVAAIADFYTPTPPTSYTAGNYNSSGVLVGNGSVVTPPTETDDFTIVDIF